MGPWQMSNVEMVKCSTTKPSGETIKTKIASIVGANVFALPYVYLPTLRWDWVTRAKSASELPLYAPIDHFSHVRTLADASYRGGRSTQRHGLFDSDWAR